jgi:membrane-bound metal-dependent hydrolase YbcI (DUF457 family)
MMPWGHFVVGAVPFVGISLARYRSFPPGHVLFALALGTQFPDIVDKPLAWGLDIIVNGRMFMHSLVFAVPVSIAVLVLAARYGARRSGVAFVFGYLLHLPGDFYSAVVGPNTYVPRNMVWPLLGTRTVSEPGFVDQPALLTLSTTDIAMLAVAGATVGLACASICRRVLWRPSG